MKHKCPSEECSKKVKYENMLCSECIEKRENHILNLLKLYLTESYLFNEDFLAQYPFKIVEFQRLKHGIYIQGYSTGFLKQFNTKTDDSINVQKIKHSINKLKTKRPEQYNSLLHLWGEPVESYKCHKSTLYRRIKSALKFIAYNIELLPVLNTIN